MFEKLRRRRSHTVTLSVSAPPAATPAVADAAMLARIDRVREALAAAGVDFEGLSAAPEPAWFADLRNGQRLPLGPAELAETADHLAGIAVEVVLSDEACTRLLSQIEVLTTLRDLKAEGIDLRFCQGGFPTDAATVRALADAFRSEIAANANAEAGAEPALKPGGVA